jgi:hypothetical protein
MDRRKASTGATNFYKYTKQEATHNPHYDTHLITIPFRLLCIAASGGGKTLFFCELLRQMGGTFEEVIVCTRCRDEPLYVLMAKRLGGLVRFYENEVPDLDEFKKDKKQRIICFDDLILSRSLNARIGEYFIRSRKFNISCVYLSQSYFAIPKIIRQQANYIVLKKIGSLKDLKLIIREFSLDLDLDSLIALYNRITANDVLDFLMIDLQDMDKRYRHNFTPLTTS